MTDYDLFFNKTTEEIKDYISLLSPLPLKGVGLKGTKTPEYEQFLKDLGLDFSGKISMFSVQKSDYSPLVIELWFSDNLGDKDSIYSIRYVNLNESKITIYENLEPDNEISKKDSNYDFTITSFSLYKYFCTKHQYYDLVLDKSETVSSVLDKIRSNYLVYKDYIDECFLLMKSGGVMKSFKETLSCDPENIGCLSYKYTYFDLLNSIMATESLTGRRMTLKEFWILHAWKYNCLNSFGYTECRKLINQMRLVSIPDPKEFWKKVDTLVKERGDDFNKTKDLYIKVQKIYYKELLELKGSISAKYGIDPSWLSDRKYNPETGEVFIPKNLPSNLSAPCKNNLKDKETFKGMLEIINKLEKELGNE